MWWGFDCLCWPWGRAFDWPCSPGGGNIWIFLCQPWDIWQRCAARGGEIWLHLTGMICPWAGEFDGKFFKNVKSPPHALTPPPPPPAGLIGALLPDDRSPQTTILYFIQRKQSHYFLFAFILAFFHALLCTQWLINSPLRLQTTHLTIIHSLNYSRHFESHPDHSLVFTSSTRHSNLVIHCFLNYQLLLCNSASHPNSCSSV